MRIFLVILILVCIISCRLTVINPAKSGVFEHVEFFQDGRGGDTIFPERLVRWYSDSAIIYEVKIKRLFGEAEILPIDEAAREPIFYRFIDLRSMIAQEYFTLSDTSKPFCSYRVNPLNKPVNYYNILSFQKVEKTDWLLTSLPDTILDHVKTKRRKAIQGNDSYVIIYIQKKKFPQFMQQLPDFPIEINQNDERIVRIERYFLDTTRTNYFKDVLAVNQKKNQLGSRISKILSAWRANSRKLYQTTLPYFPESLNECDIVLEIEKRLNGWYDQPLQK